MGKLADPARSVVPGVAVHIPFHPARDDFGISMVGGSKLDQRGLQQGLVLHQSEHGKRFRIKQKGLHSYRQHWIYAKQKRCRIFCVKKYK